jgi:hypothetical protein
LYRGNQHTIFLCNKTSHAIDLHNYDVIDGVVTFLRSESIPAKEKEMIKLFECKTKDHKFEANFRYQLSRLKQNSSIIKLYHIEISLRFNENDPTQNNLSARSLYISDDFPFSIEVPKLTNSKAKKIITIRDLEIDSPVQVQPSKLTISPDTHVTEVSTPNNDDKKDYTGDTSLDEVDNDIPEQITWSPIISVHPSQRMHKILDINKCTLCSTSDPTVFRAITFQHDIADQITHIRLFSSHSDDAIINATLDNDTLSMLSTTLSYPDIWYEMGAEELSSKKIVDLKSLQDTIIVMTDDLKLWYRGKNITSDKYSHNFVEYVNHYIEGKSLVKIGSSLEAFYILVDDGKSGILYRFVPDQEPIILNGVQDFIEGQKHMIVVANYGVIWYHDNHGDFVPDNSFDLFFQEPSEIHFLTSNERSSLLWTWDNKCFVLGYTNGIIAEELLPGSINYKSNFAYKWHPVDLSPELAAESVKQIVGYSEQYFILTESGSIWHSGTDTNAGFFKMRDIRIDVDDCLQVCVDKIVDIACIGKSLMLLLGE